MKVKLESATVCTCGGNFIYFAGPGRSRRICVVCLNQQTGIDMRGVGYSDDPELRHCDSKHTDAKQFDESDLAELVYDYGTDWVKEHYGVDLSGDLDGLPLEQRELDDECPGCHKRAEVCTCGIIAEYSRDNILEQQEKLDFEDIQSEYFDLSSGNVPF